VDSLVTVRCGALIDTSDFFQSCYVWQWIFSIFFCQVFVVAAAALDWNKIVLSEQLFQVIILQLLQFATHRHL
jgi:uncharacterized membrane protein YagU involved in acid resistance